MECVSIYTVANLYRVPAISIKIISNNEVLGEVIIAMCGKKLQEFILKILEKVKFE